MLSTTFSLLSVISSARTSRFLQITSIPTRLPYFIFFSISAVAVKSDGESSRRIEVFARTRTLITSLLS